jgi:hypothetical protein
MIKENARQEQMSLVSADRLPDNSLIPMLVGGLILTVLGMIAVLALA